jgi:hypothetical protein
MNGTNTNDPSLSLTERILFLLRDRQQQQTATTAEVSRKAIQKNLTSSLSSSDDVVTKKDVKKALKQLVKRGDLMKNGKKYKLQSSSLLSSNDNDNESNNSSDDGSRSSSASVLGEEEEIEETAPFVPIAQRIRQTTQQVKQSDTNNQDIGSDNQKQAVDLDEEIRRLEAELAQSSDDNDDEDESDDYDDASDNDGSDDVRNSELSPTAPQSNGIICLSSVADERIAPLPHGALPQNKRRTLKNIDSVGDSVSGQDATKKKSKKRKKSSQGETEEEHTISEGLKDAVNELLQNYVPSSHLKKPFYCRVCQHQSESEADFLSHKQSEFHRGAVQQERKRTYCKLCRKQLTSIVQMEEHLKSRPHREKMDFVKSKQNGGGGRGEFRNQGGRHGRDASGKQWC